MMKPVFSLRPLLLLLLLLQLLEMIAGALAAGSECRRLGCANGGVCESLGDGRYGCRCPNGWRGDNCSVNVNECMSSPCKNGAKCVDLSNKKFECHCPEGFVGLLCDMSDPCRHSPCPPHARCVVDFDTSSRYCACPVGYSGDNCDDVDECASRPCSNNATCVNTDGSYECRCPRGYQGRHCELAVDACERDRPCQNSGTCVSLSNGTYRCVCASGFFGTHCEQQQQQQRDACFPNPCENGAACTAAGNGKFACRCPPAFRGSRCEQAVDPCFPDPCVNGTCHRHFSTYLCKCRRGFEGAHCERNINDCSESSCLGRGRCVDGVNNFSCRCRRGFSGAFCEVADSQRQRPARNFCSGSPCANGSRCFNGTDSFICQCPRGFAGADCSVDIDECANGNALCSNGSTCVNVRGGYTCSCPRGFHGASCEAEVGACDGSRCSGVGTLRCGRGSGDRPRCHCRQGFAGSFCQRAVDHDDSTLVALASSPSPSPSPSPSSSPSPLLSADNVEGDGEAVRPWRSCQARTRCRLAFRNRVCDPDCDHESCLFDGGDCDRAAARPPSCPFDVCSDSFADGRCDEACNVAACGLDGGDCSQWRQQEGRYIELTVARSMGEFSTSKLLLQLTQQLGTVAVLHATTGGAAVAAAGANRTVVRVGLGDCVRPRACFRSPEFAAQLLALHTPALSITGVALRSATPLSPDRPTSQPPRASLLLPVTVACVCATLLLVLAGVLYSAAKRQRQSARVWYPDGFQPLPHAACKRTFHQHQLQYHQHQQQQYQHQQQQQQQHQQLSGHGSLASDSLLLTETESELGLLQPARKAPRRGDKLQRPDAAGSSGSAAWWPPAPCELPLHTVHSLLGPGSAVEAPLHTLISSGSAVEAPACEKTVDMIGQLLDGGYSVGGRSGPWQETPLHVAARFCRADAAQALLDGGADPNVADAGGRAPLHVAVASGAVGVSHLLMRHRRTDLNAAAADGATPLMTAARYSVEDLAEALAADPHVDVNAVDTRGRTALHWAAAVNAGGLVALLLRRNASRDAQDSNEQTPLFTAAQEGARAAVAALLDAGANRDLCDAAQRTPADVARERGHEDILHMLAQPDRRQQRAPESQFHFPTPPSSGESPQYHRCPLPPQQTDESQCQQLQQLYAGPPAGFLSPQSSSGSSPRAEHNQHNQHHQHHHQQQWPAAWCQRSESVFV